MVARGARRGGRACTRRPTLPLEPLLLRTRWSLTAPLVRLPNRPPSSRPDTCVAALVAPLSCARGPRYHGAPCPTCQAPLQGTRLKEGPRLSSHSGHMRGQAILHNTSCPRPTLARLCARSCSCVHKTMRLASRRSQQAARQLCGTVCHRRRAALGTAAQAPTRLAAALHAGAPAGAPAREALPNLAGHAWPAGVRAEAGAAGARLQAEDEPACDAKPNPKYGGAPAGRR